MTRHVERRSVWWVAILLAACAAGCHRGRTVDRFRIGFFPTVTHGAALVALERGTLARELSPIPVEAHAFSSGPEAMEALFAGALDACFVGPMPALNAFLRSHGEAVRIVAGAAAGGAAFVVARGSGITGPSSLPGKKLGTPQLGNTQDVALRAWLVGEGLQSTDRGGSVKVLPLASPDILSLMRLGELDGAWVVEPWVARLTHEAGARIFLDESARWPGGRYPTALLVVTQKLLREHPDRVSRLLAAHVETIRWMRAHPDQARTVVADAIFKYAHKRLPPEVMADAYAHVEMTWDPLAATLPKLTEEARSLDYLPKLGDPAQSVDTRLLDAELGR